MGGALPASSPTIRSRDRGGVSQREGVLQFGRRQRVHDRHGGLACHARHILQADKPGARFVGFKGEEGYGVFGNTRLDMQRRFLARLQLAKQPPARQRDIADAVDIDHHTVGADGRDLTSQPPDNHAAPRVRVVTWWAVQMAQASASEASEASFPAVGSSRETMKATCVLSAPPVPTTASLMVRGENS